ncbi:hypothetical protein D3C80_1615980 [compost metagenome]
MARSRTGVASGASPLIRTGAKTIRAPRSPGLSTSMTQASTTVGRAIAGATGPLTASVRSLATAAPPHRQVSISRISVQRRANPTRRAPSQTAPVSTAASIRGHPAGSVLMAK